VLGTAASVGAVLTFPDSSTLRSTSAGVGWAVTATVVSVALLAICVFQLVAWRRAFAQWRGERVSRLAPLVRISWILHLVSYPVVIVGLWACIAGSLAAGPTATSAALLAIAVLFQVSAQVLAAVQYVRDSGPAGTIPAYLRRLNSEIQRRR
jgi:hypothetical protein